MKTPIKQVVCMKWGTLYGADYVNKLYAMVRRNTTGELRFVCLTDNPEGVNSEVEIHKCPSMPIKEPFCNRGWRKLTLWNSEIFSFEGMWLYLDLDVVVISSLDDFFAYKPESSFLVMQNWTQLGQNIGNTSVYRFEVGKHNYLYHTLADNEAKILSKFPNSQTYISKTANSIDFWPDEWCALFKVQCLPMMPYRIFKEATIPNNVKVIAFPGVPNPHEAMQGLWPAKWYKKFYKTLKPVSWIEKYWKE